MMHLQDPRFSRVLIVTTPESNPVSEAAVLQDDLRRAGIEPYGWVINAGLAGSGTADPVLRSRAVCERPQADRVRQTLARRPWMVPWQAEGVVGERRLAALTHA